MLQTEILQVCEPNCFQIKIKKRCHVSYLGTLWLVQQENY